MRVLGVLDRTDLQNAWEFLMGRKNGLTGACLSECVGTFFLVFFGVGSVFVAVLTGALQGLFQVAIVWGLVIALGIYATSAVSGAHFNPAVTIACWMWRSFPLLRILPYIVSQLAGAFLAAALLFSLFSGVLSSYEQDKGIVRGQTGSEKSGMLFGEYFPNPGNFGTDQRAYNTVSHTQAMAAEGVGTAILVFFIFALTDFRNANRPNGSLFALFIGLTITILISVIAPLTQAGFNPARDFGPRLFAWFAGWGDIAIPGPRGGFFTVYIAAPILGGVVGGGLYDHLVRRFLPQLESVTHPE
jgi:glycerol uptake facilitator protein